MKLPDAWSLLKEMDLEAVLREAERPFQVLIVGHPDDAEALADLLSGPAGGRHPWLLCADPAEARRRAGSGLIDLAVLVTRPADPEPIVTATREVLASARVPFVTRRVRRDRERLPELPRALPPLARIELRRTREDLLDLVSEVELVWHAARVAQHASLVHDVAEGGLGIALAEAALWSGVGATLEFDDDPLALFGEVGGQLIVAVPSAEVEPDPTGSDVDVRRIGTVGGEELLGIPLAELARAHEGGP